MRTSLTSFCLLAFQLSVQAEVIIKSSFNNSLESGAGATWKGKEPEYVQGVEGKAVHLKGEHYFSLAGDLKFNQEEGSLYLWVKTDWAGNDGLMHHFVALGMKSGIRIFKDERNRLAVIWKPGDGTPNLTMGGSIAAEWPPNEWRHLAFTWKHGVYAVYLDGMAYQEGEPTAPVAPLTETTPLYLGGAKGAPGDFTADELVFCRHALSKEEVLEVFARGMEQIEKRDDPRLVMHALINDKPAALIMDTCSSLHVLFKEFAVQAGAKMMPSYRGGTIWNEETNATIMLPRTTESYKQRFIVMDGGENFRHAGIVGWMQFFAANQVVVEWDRRTAVAIPPEAVTNITQGWKEYSVPPEASVLRLPSCRIQIDGVELNLPLQIDTGAATGLSLTKKTWETLLPKMNQANRCYNAAWIPGKGPQKFISIVPATIELLGTAMHDVSVSEHLHRATDTSEYATIGLAALSHFEVVIDGVRGKLWLKPRANPAIRESLQLSGMLFLHSGKTADKKYEIEVLENSPAWNFGLRSEDQIIEADGLKPDYDDIHWQIGVKDRLGNGESIQLKVRRGEKTFDLSQKKR